MTAAKRSRLRLSDMLPLGAIGLRTRRARAALSVLGIAIGIASMVGVLGITASSQADLVARIDQLGTNLLTVVDGRSLSGDEVPLPMPAAPMIARADGVLAVTPTAELTTVHAYRTNLIPAPQTGSVTVRAANGSLLSTLGGRLDRGAFLQPANDRDPVAVLGADAARHLGAGTDGVPARVWLTGHGVTVLGVLQPVQLAPEVGGSVRIRLSGWALRVGDERMVVHLHHRGRARRIAALAADVSRPDSVPSADRLLG